jgi:hypothetical protein
MQVSKSQTTSKAFSSMFKPHTRNAMRDECNKWWPCMLWQNDSNRIPTYPTWWTVPCSSVCRVFFIFERTAWRFCSEQRFSLFHFATGPNQWDLQQIELHFSSNTSTASGTAVASHFSQILCPSIPRNCERFAQIIAAPYHDFIAAHMYPCVHRGNLSLRNNNSSEQQLLTIAERTRRQPANQKNGICKVWSRGSQQSPSMILPS